MQVINTSQSHPQHHRRIKILSKLKVLWRTSPKDMKKINELQKELNQLKKSVNIKPKTKGQYG